MGVSRLRLSVASVLAGLVALTSAAVALSSTASGSEAADSVGIRLLDVPAGAVDDPRARLYIVDHVAPGTSFQRRVEVSTTSAAPTAVELYAGGASVANGVFAVADGRTANELSTWTLVDPSALNVPSRGKAVATVTIAVPGDAAPGERYAVVWVETRSSPGPAGGVTQVNRVGIRVYLSVGPGGPPAAAFEIDSLTAARSDDGRPMVLASVHNTGGRALDLDGSLSLLDGPGGLTAGPFPVDLGVTVGIAETVPVEIPLDARLPAGPWDAQLTLASGLVERTVRGELTFPDTGASPAVPAEPVASAPIVPALLGLVAILGVSVVLLALGMRSRQRS
ncbi:MAG: peptidase [Actinobacteria bacterium]|nr:peptidase [Actinomycetota bacterium]